MPRKSKKPAGPPPDASLLGIPPEMRNTIYRLVADDIDEVNIIGRKLDQNEATSEDDAWLWNAIAKHPLSQTCRQLRQEFDPIHRRRAMTTGVAQYRLDLENIDIERVENFSRLTISMPQLVRDKLEQIAARDCPIIRFNLTDNIFTSIHKLEKRWGDLKDVFTKMQCGIDINKTYITFHSYEFNLNLRTRTMSSAQKRIKPIQISLNAVEKLGKISEDVWSRRVQAPASAELLDRIFAKLDSEHKNHFRLLREARERKARQALKDRLEVELRSRLRDELKAELKGELRAEIMDELKHEAEAELGRQIQDGLESWSSG